MVDEEVESILREIRERVLSEPPVTAFNVGPAATGNGTGNGTAMKDLESGAATAEVALIGSYLTTTARAWDQLPPLISNRRGILARLELWVKRRLKTATHWFIWEQVNFNAAVHHALRDTLEALLDYGRVLETLRAEIRAESDERRMVLDKYQFETDRLRTAVEGQRVAIDAQRVAIETQRLAIETQRLAIETQRVATETKQRSALEAQLTALEAHRAEIETQRLATEAKQRTALEAHRVTSEAKRIQGEARLLERMGELRECDNRLQDEQRVTSEAKRIQGEARLLERVGELRERDNRLQDEQRICFKQLSLETSETAVLEERTRRKVEALLKELTRRIEELENRKS